MTTQPPALQHALASGDIPPVPPRRDEDLTARELEMHLKAWVRRDIELRLWGVGLATRQEHNP